MSSCPFDTSCGGVTAACASIDATTGAAEVNSLSQQLWGSAMEKLSDSYNNFVVSSSPEYGDATEQAFAVAYNNALNDPTGANMQTFLDDVMNQGAGGNSEYINYLSNKAIVALQNYIPNISNPQSNPNLQQNLSTTLSSLKTLVQQAEQSAQSPQQTEAQALQSVNGQIVSSIQTTSQAGGTAAGFGGFLANLLQGI